MYNHLRTHTGERPFMCMITGNDCEFGLVSLFSLTPMFKSTSKPELICESFLSGCGKRFSRPDSLTTHVKTHSNVRPYVCPVKGCGKAYYHSRSLRKHEKTHDVRHQGHGLPPFAGHPYMHAHVDYRQPHGMYNPRPPHGYAPSHHYHPHPHYPPPSYPFPGPGLSAHHLKNEQPVSSPGAAAVAAAQAAASNRNYSVPPLMPSDMYHRSPMEIYPNPGQNNGSSSNPPSGSSSPNAGSPSLPSSARIPSRLPPLSQMQGHQNPASGLYPPPLSLKFPNSSPGPLSFGSNHGGPHPYPTPGASPPYAHPPTLPSPAVGGPMPFPTPNGASQSPMQFQFFR
ncbi:hypothetical protein BC938DRAFT_477597 [Jimgerdemannia flammicorona]|uniref:C2H2-type domain-containing protein n=1 Tax=Jimgerdemannia flammicorona TaxID=994334 RepID=A0A433P8R8_9FUNG|nr:hypothetical protein BC938DRAFT_477597 [Jimgerdemannia flammicorona]